MKITHAIIISAGMIISSVIISLTLKIIISESLNQNVIQAEIKSIAVWNYPIGTQPSNSASSITEGKITINTTAGLVIVTKPDGLKSIYPLNRVEIREVIF